jgi:hypothetical protein
MHFPVVFGDTDVAVHAAPTVPRDDDDSSPKTDDSFFLSFISVCPPSAMI